MKMLSAKQPWEELSYRFGFEEALVLIDEDIGSIDSVQVHDMTDLTTDLAATMNDDTYLSFSGTDVFVRITGGSDAHRYKITVRIISDTTLQKCELEAILPVREI